MKILKKFLMLGILSLFISSNTFAALIMCKKSSNECSYETTTTCNTGIAVCNSCTVCNKFYTGTTTACPEPCPGGYYCSWSNCSQCGTGTPVRCPTTISQAPKKGDKIQLESGLVDVVQISAANNYQSVIQAALAAKAAIEAAKAGKTTNKQ